MVLGLRKIGVEQWLISLVVACFSMHANANQETPRQLPTIEFEGKHGGHLQGIATAGNAIFWSHTVQLVRTTDKGKVTHRIDVKSHHGDLTYFKGKLYVAVEFGEFNQPVGKTDSWIFVYAAEDLRLISKHRLREPIHGCGGIAYGDGRFMVVGGLPKDKQQNYVFEYDTDLKFKTRHILPSGQTRLGIQTAGFFDGHWWFGCYGSPKNPGLLKANKKLQLIGTSKTDFSYGVARLNERTILRGKVSSGGRQGSAERLSKMPSLIAFPTN